MGWFIFFIVVIVILVAGNAIERSENEKKVSNNTANSKKIRTTINEFDEDSITFISKNKETAVALSEDEREVLIMSATQIKSDVPYIYKERTIKFDDIIQSEVIIDNETVTKTARGSQVGGAVIGGVLLGGVGAIIGGLSGGTRSKEEIRNIDIKLTVNDMNDPVSVITFLHDIDFESEFRERLKRGHSKDSVEFTNAIKQAEKWQGMFDVILKSRNN